MDMTTTPTTLKPWTVAKLWDGAKVALALNDTPIGISYRTRLKGSKWFLRLEGMPRGYVYHGNKRVYVEVPVEGESGTQGNLSSVEGT